MTYVHREWVAGATDAELASEYRRGGPAELIEAVRAELTRRGFTRDELQLLAGIVDFGGVDNDNLTDGERETAETIAAKIAATLAAVQAPPVGMALADPDEYARRREARAALIGESIAADVREAEPVPRVSTNRRYLEGDTLDPRCTGYIDELGYLAHDGDTCPVHESGDNDPGDEGEADYVKREALEAMDAPALRQVIREGGPAAVVDAARQILADRAEQVNTPPLLDTLASMARTALDDPAGVGLDDGLARLLEIARDPRRDVSTLGIDLLDVHRTLTRAHSYAVAMLDQIINSVNPAELTVETAPAVVQTLGRQLADFRDRLEAEGQIEPGRSMIGDHITAALDEIDHAADALGEEDETTDADPLTLTLPRRHVELLAAVVDFGGVDNDNLPQRDRDAAVSIADTIRRTLTGADNG